jgi:diphosphomevalonate decarboxylase
LSALLKLKGLDVPLKTQSMLARLGSGSAARGFWDGMVLWHKGIRADGMDCYAEPLAHPVRDFCISVLVLDKNKKAVSSRNAMAQSLADPARAANWAAVQEKHLEAALAAKDFDTLGRVTEENAVLLHDTCGGMFDMPETVAWKQTVARWRGEGLPVYFTQDAGAQLKVIFPAARREEIERRFTAAALDYFTVAA